MKPLYRFGPFILDSDAHALHRGKEPVHLQKRTYDVLWLLLRNRNRLVTKDELIEQVWEANAVSDSAIDYQISFLRRALGDDPLNPAYIATSRKLGYRFIAKVTEVLEEDTGTPLEPHGNAETPPVEHEGANQKPFGSAPAIDPRPKKSLLTLAGMAILAAGLVFAFLFWFYLAHQSSAKVPTVQGVVQASAWPGLTLFPAISPDGSRIAYASDHNGSFEIYVREFAADAPELQLTATGGEDFEPAWSPDGQRIAYYSKKRRGIWEVPATGGTPRQISLFGSRPAWSPDGTLIAFQSNGLVDLGSTARNALAPSTLWVVPLVGGAPKQLTLPGTPSGGHGSPSWSPDGKRIVFEADQFDGASVWSMPAEGGAPTRISPGWGYDPIFAPDGKGIYFCLNGLWKVAIAPDTGAPVGKPVLIMRPSGPTEMRYPSISEDGKKIAYAALSQDSNIWSLKLAPNLSPLASSALTHDAGARNSSPAFSPDGRKITFDSGRMGTSIDVWIMNEDGSGRAQLTTHPKQSDVNHLSSWFPGLDEVAYLAIRDGKPTMRAVSLASRRERLLLDIGPDFDFCRLSPDGAQVAFTRKEDGVINTWTTALDGGRPSQLTFDREMAGFPIWSPDGKWLALELKRGDSTQIAVMPSGGGPITQLTFDQGQSWPYGWSPDSDKVVFAGLRDGYWNIRWVSRTTKEEKQVTDYRKLNAFVRYPAWSPTGDQIAYEYTETKGDVWAMLLK